MTTNDNRTLPPPARLMDAIRPWIDRTPDRLALVDAGGSWTYRQLAAAVAATGHWLAERGIRPGDRVMIVGGNCRAVIALFLAVTGIDAWPVLVNARLAWPEIAEIAANCGAHRVFYETDASVPARTHARDQGAVRETIAEGVSFGVGTLDETAIPEASGGESDQVAALVYTSGSTGRPKGVMLTHENLLFIAAASSRIRSLAPADRVCGVLPISHIVGLAVVTLGSLTSGASLHLFARFNPAEILSALRGDGLTVLLGTPAMYTMLLDYAGRQDAEPQRSSSLRIISVSGAPLDPAVKAATEHLFGLPLHHGYGITECSPTIAQIRPDSPREDCSVGPLLPGVEAILVGPDGRVLTDGGVGELRVRGPNVMKGYYRDPVGTAAVVDPEGWFNTGDLARFEGENLFIVGRTKELIIRFGFNVYPAEIEAVLNMHPAIRQSAVVGRRAGADNEEIVAFTEPVANMTATPAELASFLASRLASYKQPTRIIMLEHLPTTPGGKIAKRALVDLAADL